MNTQTQNLPQLGATVESNPFADLLAMDHKPAPIAITGQTVTVETGKRFVALQEIMGEVEVERELDYTINVCAICGKSDCSCQPRRIIAVKAKVSFPVEMAVATVIVPQ